MQQNILFKLSSVLPGGVFIIRPMAPNFKKYWVNPLCKNWLYTVDHKHVFSHFQASKLFFFVPNKFYYNEYPKTHVTSVVFAMDALHYTKFILVEMIYNSLSPVTATNSQFDH